jgi:hypothetical protein
MSRLQARYLYFKHPIIRQFIREAWEHRQEGAIYDMMIGLELEDGPTFH